MSIRKISKHWSKGKDVFVDVTLVCEDGQRLEAHLVILAASSAFFQILLRKIEDQKQLIYMKGVPSSVAAF